MSTPAADEWLPLLKTAGFAGSADRRTIGWLDEPLTPVRSSGRCWPGAKAKVVPGAALSSACLMSVPEKGPPVARPFVDTVTVALATWFDSSRGARVVVVAGWVVVGRWVVLVRGGAVELGDLRCVVVSGAVATTESVVRWARLAVVGGEVLDELRAGVDVSVVAAVRFGDVRGLGVVAIIVFVVAWARVVVAADVVDVEDCGAASPSLASKPVWSPIWSSSGDAGAESSSMNASAPGGAPCGSSTGSRVPVMLLNSRPGRGAPTWRDAVSSASDTSRDWGRSAKTAPIDTARMHSATRACKCFGSMTIDFDRKGGALEAQLCQRVIARSVARTRMDSTYEMRFPLFFAAVTIARTKRTNEISRRTTPASVRLKMNP